MRPWRLVGFVQKGLAFITTVALGVVVGCYLAAAEMVGDRLRVVAGRRAKRTRPGP